MNPFSGGMNVVSSRFNLWESLKGSLATTEISCIFYIHTQSISWLMCQTTVASIPLPERCRVSITENSTINICNNN